MFVLLTLFFVRCSFVMKLNDPWNCLEDDAPLGATQVFSLGAYWMESHWEGRCKQLLKGCRVHSVAKPSKLKWFHEAVLQCTSPDSLSKCTLEQYCYYRSEKLVALVVLPVSHTISGLTPGRPSLWLCFFLLGVGDLLLHQVIAVFLNILAGVKHKMFCTD